MTEHPDFSPDDFLDEIVADDPANRRLAAELRNWCATNTSQPAQPDVRLSAMFSREPEPAPSGGWRQWLQRPAVAFAATFAAVLLLGVGAFALVARSGSGTDVASATTSSLSAAEAANAATAQITLPEDLSEQTGYAGCVVEQLTAWLSAGLAAEEAPAIIDECGNPPIPELGPEATVFRADLQTWSNCMAAELQAVLPGLPEMIKGGEKPTVFDACGDPPDPRDYGLELPFLDFDFESLDPSRFSFGPFNFGDLNLDELHELHELDIPGLLEDMNLEDLEAQFEACLADLQDGDAVKPESLEDLRDFDFSVLFANLEACDLPLIAPFHMFGQGLEGIDLEWLDLEGFDLHSLLQGLELDGLDLGSLNLEGVDLEGLDKLLAGLMGDEELDMHSLLEQLRQKG